MLRIVLATARPQAMQAFAAALSLNPEVHLQPVGSGAEVLEAARTSAPHLVIIDTGLADHEPLELVQKLLMVNAMVNTVVVSPLSEEEFHEASEGLGVLGRLPGEPGESDAADLLYRLKKGEQWDDLNAVQDHRPAVDGLDSNPLPRQRV